MPDPTRLTPLAAMLLAQLREGDSHPYEMMRLLHERKDDRLVPLQKGTIYHTVTRLERDGLVEEVRVDRDGNRPERTTYTLTPAGRAAIDAWVRAELPQIDRAAEFRVALAEAHNLDRDEVIALLDERRALLATSHDDHETALRGAHLRGVPEKYMIEVERQAALLAAELAWQDSLRTRLADDTLPWDAGDLTAHPTPRVPEETTA